ncbi:hypothetical protein CMO84_08030 [Candidatus Woesearchaeota archaeon]|jgi:hypothetical protein|nr:hypothetical protein [Candidatus Woesearchaeota archaeon]
MCVLIPSSLAGSVQDGYAVVDTGQDRCYDDKDEMAPPAPGDAFYGQDAQHQGLQPSYLDNGDGTVSDLNTGLMWQQSPDFDTKRSWSACATYADALVLAGHSDWRLPTVKELYSLIDFRGSSTANPAVPYIDTTYFAFEYPDPSSGDRPIDVQFWSSTAYVGTTMNGDATAFGVNFADGRIKGYPSGTLPNGTQFERYVRCVRGTTTYGVNNFVDNGDGTITDVATNLMWAKSDSTTPLDWEAALAYAENSTLAGATDWRLPNVKELQSIVDYTRALDATDPAQVGPAIDPIFDIVDPQSWAWSSTTHLDPPLGTLSWAAYVCFGLGTGWMEQPPGSGNYNLLNVHGAGCQRSDPKAGDPNDYPYGNGPQGDVIRIFNSVRLVRDAGNCSGGAVSYCTPKVTSSGCAATISGSGTPSATASSGFTVTVSGVESGQFGIMFYGTSGSMALPFRGGLLCVQGSLVRLPVQSSGSPGGPICGGVLSMDLNALGVCAAIGQGNRAWIQAWFRDPPGTYGTGLSDALTFSVCR